MERDRLKINNDTSVYVSQQNGVPHKQSVQSLNYARDSKLVKKIKQEAQHRCQICSHTISVGGNKFYSEGHHIKPLGNDHEGVADEDNIIILCPNHHNGAIAIDPATSRIIHLNKVNPFHGRELAYIRHLNPQYLTYHLQHIFKKS